VNLGSEVGVTEGEGAWHSGKRFIGESHHLVFFLVGEKKQKGHRGPAVVNLSRMSTFRPKASLRKKATSKHLGDDPPISRVFCLLPDDRIFVLVAAGTNPSVPSGPIPIRPTPFFPSSTSLILLIYRSRVISTTALIFVVKNDGFLFFKFFSHQ
jgi:hypothetical protein